MSAPGPPGRLGGRIPPGQVLTAGWPVLHAGSIPTDLTPESWTLALHGDLERPRTLSYRDLLALPQKEIECDIHCVTSWTKLGMRWKGVPFRAIVDEVAPRPSVQFVVMECEQGFTTSLPLAPLLEDDVMVAHTVDGRALPSEHGGPVRMLVPKRYFYKSAKWLRGLKFVRQDEPGFWEVRGYSNIADPWSETRYTVDDVKLIHKMRRARYSVRSLPIPTVTESLRYRRILLFMRIRAHGCARYIRPLFLTRNRGD